mgnify:CR=1 FL=1
MNLYDELQSIDLDDLLDRLTSYATNRLKSAGLKDLGGKEPFDFVGDLLLKVIEGTRDWENANCSFTDFMFGSLRSEISNFLKGSLVGKRRIFWRVTRIIIKMILKKKGNKFQNYCNRLERMMTN